MHDDYTLSGILCYVRVRQEMQFINGMVRLGKFELEELDNVVAMLFPAKTQDERKAILDKLCEGYKAPTPPPQKPG